MDQQPVCDVCGAPATNRARDMMRHEPAGAMYAEFSPVGGVKYGCEDHPTQSDEYLTRLPHRENLS